MKILLFGANGQVGYELLRCLAPLGELHSVARQAVVGSDHHHVCDLTDEQAIGALLNAVQPVLIVNAAAHTAVDDAEDHVELATQLNATAPGLMATWAANNHAALVHYSTDYVFAGDATAPYRETDPTGPVGVYGSTKLAGEQAVIASGCDHLIFRTSWVYANRGKNFLLTMLRLASERDQLSVVDDQIGSPTCARTLAQLTTAAVRVVERGHWRELGGLYHLSSIGHTSWYGFADYLLNTGLALGLIGQVPKLQVVTSEQFPSKAKRPAWSVLDNSQFEACFKLRVPPWQLQASQCLADTTRPSQASLLDS